MLKRAVMTAGICVIMLGVGVLAGVMGWRRFAGESRPPQILDTPAILRQVQTLSQLVTVKYVLNKVVVLDDAKWYGDNRVTLVAHGVVKAGVDLSQIGPEDLQISGQSITIKLPRPVLTDVYLDDHRTEIVERSTGLLRAFDKDLEQNARRQTVDELRHAATESGILQEADERARAQLTGLLYHLGFTEVEVRAR